MQNNITHTMRATDTADVPAAAEYHTALRPICVTYAYITYLKQNLVKVIQSFGCYAVLASHRNIYNALYDPLYENITSFRGGQRQMHKNLVKLDHIVSEICE